MGVPKFFRYISERYPCLSELVRDYEIPDFDNLYLDMNGIIHICSHPNDGDAHFRISEEKIIQDIFHYIEVLFRMIKPKKLFFMAVDGVAPRAKMNQQRGRRFRSAKEAEKLETEALARGEQLPTEARFDSNCITPGTVFMARLHEQLKYFVVNKISTDKLWQGCKIILSGHETPGEGEHKIMDYIRYMRSQPNYDPNTRHCLYGLDADLLMLGMCTHEPHFCLLREEVKFGKKSTKRKCVPEEISFYLLHLSLMREYLDLEFASLKDTLPFDYDIEKIIDDWVLMGFLVGNDFIPHLPNMHIANGALPVLYEAYIKILPSLGGYINEGGTLNLERFEKYLDSLRSIDIENFSEHYADLKYFEGKTGRRPNDKERTSYKPKQLEAFEFEEKVNEVELEPEKTSTDSGLAALIKATDDMFLEPEKSKSTAVEPSDANLSNLEEEFEGDFDYESDQSTDDDLFNEEFRLHKRDYYMNKLEYSQVTPEVLKSQAEGYVRAIQWNLNYYYNGVCSWSWYYPHHYAPYLSDIKGFGDLKLDFELGKPFKPYEQLLAVLPAASKSLLPECYQDLMTSENSPLKHYYPTEFKTDLNGKRQDWEALVLIPFIDEDVLLKAMEPHSKKLSLEEIKRNTHRPMLVYSYTKEDLGNYEAPQYFPPIKNNHAECMALSIDDIRIPVEKLVKGRYPGAKKDVFYPGFPTFRHLNYTGTLEKAKVKVFEQPSRSDNMIINVIPKPLLSEDALARQILGNTVFIGWPHLREALAVSITTSNYKYNYVEGYPGQYNLEDLRDSRTLSFEANGTILHYKNRLGINVGETKAVVHAKPLVGRKCIYTPKGEVSFEKQWDKTPANYPYQTIIYGIKYYEEGFSKFSNIQLLFPVDSECFLLTHPMYGSVGKIMDSKETLPKGRLKLSVKVQEEPNLNSIIEMEHKMSMEYMQLSAAASRLSISRNVFSRITGTIYLLSRNDMPSESTYKMNVGLNLKFNVKNQEIPGYTKRVGNVWLYSQKAIDLVQSYILFCPELFQFLNMSDKNDDIFKEDLFPENCDERVKGLKEWLKQQPYQSIERLTCGSEVMDPESVKKLENLIDAFCENLNSLPKPKNTVMQVKPYLLYKPGLQTGNIMPDPSTNFQLCDRVINVRESYTVPLALKGTIIAIHKSTTGSDSDVVYDVLFDSPFVGGLTLNCSPNRAYRLPPTAMINISYGARMYKKMTGEPGQLLQTLKAANNLNYRNQPQNSAFAAFMDVNRSVPSVSNYSNNYRPHVYQNKSQPALSVFGAYPQQFGGPYQQKPFNKGFNQPVINTNNKGTVNMASNIKAHNNFMPNFVNNGISMSTKQTHLKPENKIPNKGSPKKEPAAPVKVIDTEILKKVLKISDTETDKTPPRVKQEDAKRRVAEIKPSRSTEQKILKKDLVNMSINVPAPPTSWVTSTMPQQKVQTQVYHREKIVTRSSVEKVTKSNESLQDLQSKTVFVPLQAERAHLKNQNSTSYNTKKGDPSPKKDQQNQPGSTQKLENAQKDDKKDSSNQNTGVKKQRKVRMAANFSVKMSLP